MSWSVAVVSPVLPPPGAKLGWPGDAVTEK